jgi:2'-5' RNA ligase
MPGNYAVVAYVHDPVGELVEALQRELHPERPQLPAHLTILPPRALHGAEPDAVERLEDICRDVQPFEIRLGDVETFLPITPTVFIRVAHAAYRMRELHDHLNVGALSFDEPWPYMPHLTICKLDDNQRAADAARIARERWDQYRGSRTILLEQLTFVRETQPNSWLDLAPVPLGRRLAVR